MSENKKDLIQYYWTAFKNFDYSAIIIHTKKPGSISINRKLFTFFNEKYPNICFSTAEFVYLCEHHSRNFLSKLFCPECGKRLKFVDRTIGYYTFCSVSCASNNPSIKNKRKNTNLRKYGVEHPQQCKEVRQKTLKTNLELYGGVAPACSSKVQEKIKATNLRKYGVERPTQNEEIKAKVRSTNVTNWGVEYISQSEKIKEKVRQTSRKRYNTDNPSQSKEVIDKIRKTNLRKYGVEWAQQCEKIAEKRKKTCLERYGTESPFESKSVREKIRQSVLNNWGVECILDSKEIRDKIKRTNKIRYGNEVPYRLKEFQDKSLQSKRINKSFNTSSVEDKLYEDLCRYFPKIIRQYTDERYPYNCDFYIPINDLFIELNAHWTHGEGLRLFDSNNKQHQKKLKYWKKRSKTSVFYKNAIHVWTVSDVEKYNTAKKNGLNYLVFYSLKEARQWLEDLYDKSYYKSLDLIFSENFLLKEYNKVQSFNPTYDTISKDNNIVLYFQQKEFYKKERELWEKNDNKLRKRLVLNRVKYLNKGLGQLTRREILRGFKISGIYSGYSHFNPQWLRKFILDYKVTSIYDPCGGWGHRLIALSRDFKYIYNDINTPVYQNVRKISKFLEMKNKVFYNKDASKFYPEKYVNKVDAIFTCPPYYNTEIYSKQGCENLSYNDFLNWWSDVVENCLSLKPRIFAFVISEKYKKDMQDVCKNMGLKLCDIHELKSPISHFHKSKNTQRSKEVLIVFNQIRRK